MTDPWRETEHIVDQMRQQLDRAAPSTGGQAAEQLVGIGEAQHGMVYVEVTGGRVLSVQIHPRAMRQPSGDLGTAITEATNAAFDDAQAALTASVPVLPSLEEMSRTLANISAESTRAMDRAAAGVDQCLPDRLRPGAAARLR